jgi:signal transduction histidine kinase
MHSEPFPADHRASTRDTIRLGANALSLVKYLTLALLALCLTGLALNLEAGRGWRTDGSVPGIMLCVLVLILIHYRKIRAALSILLWSLTLLPLTMGMLHFGIEAPGMFFVPVAVMAGCLLLSPRQGMAMAVSALLLCAMFYWLGSGGIISISKPLPMVKVLVMLGTLLVASIIGIIGARLLHAEFARVTSLAASLALKAAQLQQSEQAQRELNQELESRVLQRTEELSKALAELKQTQNELVQAEKLGALGAMVAGVAHELNTPVGNVLMVTSSLAERQLEFERQLDSGLTRSALIDFLGSVREVTCLMDRNLQRIADIVASFKQVAVNQHSEQRRRFELKALFDEALGPTLKMSPWVLENSVPANLCIDSYPGPLAQALLNLLNNAMRHGFEGRSQGRMQLSATPLNDGWLRIVFSDDGVGIPSINLPRIFDPFFTTRMGQGGSGLGLCIVYNIVTGILNGRIEVFSTVAAGSTGTAFHIDIPLTPPPEAASAR